MDESSFLSATAFQDARHWSESTPWLGHIPFAFWITEATVPGLIVELGTHTGNSYFSFCQAVRQLGLGTRCCAVDTWKGDIHSGLYGEEVYQRVLEINQRDYALFSHLIRSTFDEAVAQFQASSIDLLHIDGLHTYTAVKHDFDTWLPKLSERAVVLLHDTNVHQPGFGVHLFFDELKKRYPTFEFLHSSGLGVVGVGERLPDRVRQLLEIPAASPLSQKIRACYARLGQQPFDRLILSNQGTLIEDSQRKIVLLRERIADSQQRLEQAVEENQDLQQRLEQAVEENQDLQHRASAAETQVQEVLTANAVLTQKRSALVLERDAMQEQINWIQQSVGGRMLCRLRRIRGSWFGEGTLSGRCLTALIRFTEMSMNEGVSIACRHAVIKVGKKGRAMAGRSLQAIRTIGERTSHAARRFGAIARSDGLSVAVQRAWRKARMQSSARLQDPGAGIGLLPRSCSYFVPPLPEDPYECWRRVNQDSPRRRRSIAQAAGTASAVPYFSVLVPVYNSPRDVLDAAISSVARQSLQSWELILVDDASTHLHVRPLLESWSVRDHRIRVYFRYDNGNISVATNQAAEAARGVFLVLLDHDDLLDPNALSHLSLYLQEHPDAELVYSDDDKVDMQGRHHSPQFKPGWSPELLLSYCYTGHLTAVRRSLYHEVGGMRIGFEGSQDHDFWLRASERTRETGHVPQLVYHWRVLPGSTAASGHAKPHSFEAGRRAVEEAFRRRGVFCSVVQPEWASRAGCAIFQPVMPDDGPSVAILIPSKNHEKYLKRLLGSLEKTTYRNYRIYIIDNESDDPATLKFLATVPHRVLRIASPGGVFNFAAINNRAAEMVEEELLLFLNDDTEMIEPRWLSQMVGWSRLEGIGAVGARLLFPDRRIQHAGVIHGLHDGHAEHAFRYLPWWDAGYLGLARVTRNCLAVTAACMLTPRELFQRMGEFDEERFGVAYNDVDYCYRLADAGFRCVYCAEAELYHHEGASRGSNDNPREVASYREIHGHRTDPYFSSHLNPHSVLFEVRPTVIPSSSHARRIPMLAVTHNLNWEGAPRFEFGLLSRLSKAGWIDPLVLSPCDGPLRREYENAGIRIEVDPEFSACLTDVARYQASVSRLSERIERGGFELVHANTLQAFWAIDAARRAQVPSVWSLHESEPWYSYYDNFPEEIARAALSSFAHPYRIVFTARSTLQAWRELETRKNFDLIKFALDIERFQAELARFDRSSARIDLGLQDDELCVLLLGTVCERKGQHDLLQAYAALSAEVAGKLRCLVVGARDSLAYSRDLRQQAAELPPDRRGGFQIFAETDETAKYWLASDVFCCTSRVESYPAVVLEAMASGLPIITTPVFGISEQVRPGINALFYQPGDVQAFAGHLESLVKNQSYRRSLSECAQWVLRGLPTRREMVEKYRRTFQAAAESSVFEYCDPPLHAVSSPDKTGARLILDPPHGLPSVGEARRKAGLVTNRNTDLSEKGV